MDLKWLKKTIKKIWSKSFDQKLQKFVYSRDRNRQGGCVYTAVLHQFNVSYCPKLLSYGKKPSSMVKWKLSGCGRVTCLHITCETVTRICLYCLRSIFGHAGPSVENDSKAQCLVCIWRFVYNSSPSLMQDKLNWLSPCRSSRSNWAW